MVLTDIVKSKIDDALREEEPIMLLKSYLELSETIDRNLLAKKLAVLTKDPTRTFLQPPSIVYNFHVKEGKHTVVVESLYKLDGRLRKMHNKLVPSRVKGHVFWTNYLSRLFLLVQEFIQEYEDKKQSIFDEFNQITQQMRQARDSKERINGSTNNQSNTQNSVSVPSPDMVSPVKTVFSKFETLRIRQRDALQSALRQAVRFVRHHIKDTETTHLVVQHEQNVGETTSWIEFALQAILMLELSRSGLYYPAIPEHDGMSLKDEHKEVKDKIVSALRQFYAEDLEEVHRSAENGHSDTTANVNKTDSGRSSGYFLFDKEEEEEPLTEKHILNLIGNASYDDMTDYVWIIDPVDSTKNFLKNWKSQLFQDGTSTTNGIFSCCVSVALVKDGDIIMSGLAAPHTKFKGKKNQLSYEGRLIYSERNDKKSSVHIYHINDSSDHTEGDVPSMGLVREIEFDTTCSYTKLLQFCKSAELTRNAGVAASLLMQLGGLQQDSLKYGYFGMLLPSEEKEEDEGESTDLQKENYTMEDYFQIKPQSSVVHRAFCTPYYLEVANESQSSMKVYRHAAASFIIQQAGGNVTDIKGKPLRFDSGRMLRDVKAVVATALPKDAHMRFCQAIASMIDPSPVSFCVSVHGTPFVDEKMIKRAIAEALELPLQQVVVTEQKS